MMKDHAIPWRQVLLKKEFDDEVARKYKIKSIPQNYVIGPDGKIAGTWISDLPTK